MVSAWLTISSDDFTVMFMSAVTCV